MSSPWSSKPGPPPVLPPVPPTPPPAMAAPPSGLEADLLVDRRRLKRSRGFWRLVAVLVILGGIAAATGSAEVNVGWSGLSGPHVVRLTVSGTITDDRRLVEAIDRATRDDSVRGLVLVVDSPGGTVAGGESLHAALSRFRQSKPVVAVFGGTAASAGYMIAMPAERVFARESSVTGSIGVLLQSFDVQEGLARLGVRAEAITSGPLKDQPSPFRPLTPEGRAALQSVVSDLHAQFVRMVAEGRHMPEDRVRALADGRILTGRQALAAGLVDAIGGEPEARAYLAETRGIAADLPIRDLRARNLRDRALGGFGEAIGAGFGRALGGALKALISEGLSVDGGWALWQPSAR
ncbi:signal peptide peptidase SppA [Muricoccus radiodurans]|uniref:signal peptide peptidase SppA n=1 Tax=Muricoccus radiodurans TaxID=2231721 RepID=UPI003CE9C482